MTENGTKKQSGRDTINRDWDNEALDSQRQRMKDTGKKKH